MAERKCETCEWWRKLGANNPGRGECRRYPPMPVTRGDADETWSDDEWPYTADENWCGEHKQKEGERE